jgi:hypothetical protein
MVVSPVVWFILYDNGNTRKVNIENKKEANFLLPFLGQKGYQMKV